MNLSYTQNADNLYKGAALNWSKCDKGFSMFLAATKQLLEHFFRSVHLSARNTFLTMFLSS